MKKHFSGIIVVLLLIAMALTCPSYDTHIDKISEAIAQKSVVLKLIGKDNIKVVVDKIVCVDNYVFVSVGTYMLNEDKSVVSLGIFGHVFTFTKDDILEELNRII